jgi:preprotein translocase subunit SecF
MEKIITSNEAQKGKGWYDRYYKLLAIIPLIFVVLSLIYLFNFHSQTGDFINKDVSLSGGTTITINAGENINFDSLQEQLQQNNPDLSFRKLTDLRSGESIALIIESSEKPEQLKSEIEDILGFSLTADNSSTEFTGDALSSNFYKQLITALILSFVLMSLVILFLFRSFVPSFGVIFAGFSNMVIPLALIDFLGIKLSAAGIAAFLMIIGYSVDTNILLTTRAVKTREGTLNSRIYGAFKTGMLMSITALSALLPAFFIVTGLPDSFRQIFLILSLGLISDIFNTWTTNAGIIKWYCERKGIN